jgi:hypothetical protein
MNSQAMTQLVPVEHIERLIHLARAEKVLLDADLAMLYGVTTGNLNKAVKRNQQRFPSDFMFQLSDEEAAGLIFQSGRSKQRGGRRHNPYAFTEQGVAMLSFRSRAIITTSWKASPLRANSRSRPSCTIQGQG